MLLPGTLLLGFQIGVWQLAFVPGDRAAGLRAGLPWVWLGRGAMHSLLPTLPAGTRGTDTHC